MGTQEQDVSGALPTGWQGRSHYGEEPLCSHVNSLGTRQACWKGRPRYVQANEQAPRDSCCPGRTSRHGRPEHVYLKEEDVQGAGRELLTSINGGCRGSYHAGVALVGCCSSSLMRVIQALLVGRDALLVLDLRLDVVDRVRRLDLKRDGLASERLDEDLHAAAQAKHQVERRLLLDVVVGEGAPVLELLAREDQALLVGRDALLVLDLRLDVVDRVGRLH